MIKQINKVNIKNNSPLYSIYKKVKNHQRINENEALELFKSNDILTIAEISDITRKRFNKNNAYYIINRQINYSNICSIRCSFCSFRKSEGQEGSYTMSKEDVVEKLKTFSKESVKEIHMVGGLHPKLPFKYYMEIISAMKETQPEITIKAFTAVEIAYFASIYKMTSKEILSKLIKSGLGAMPGGGAEIFAEKIRRKICPRKINGEEWLNIHNTAHSLGIKTNATMLFGHIEAYEDRIDHMEKLRKLQDKTKGFLSFIPLTYHPDNNPLRSDRTSCMDELKTIAISRIYLDNIPHIKAYWIMIGMKMAQLALDFGADDLDGTVKEERIYHAAGAKTPQTLSKSQLSELITEAGKIPVERDSMYNHVKNIKKAENQNIGIEINEN